jgi:hypothetical protein
MKAITNVLELIEKDRAQITENGINKMLCYTFPITEEVAFFINKVQIFF